MATGARGASGQPVGSTVPTGGAVSALTQHPAMEVRSARAPIWTPETVPATSVCTVSLLHLRSPVELSGLILPSPREVMANGVCPLP